VTGRTPSEHYREFTERFGEPAYAHRRRLQLGGQGEARQVLRDDVRVTELAGEKIIDLLTSAPGQRGAAGWAQGRHGGWRGRGPVVRHRGRLKVYAESFRGPEHLARIQEAAQDVVAAALG
jgi:phosphoglucomutase